MDVFDLKEPWMCFFSSTHPDRCGVCERRPPHDPRVVHDVAWLHLNAATREEHNSRVSVWKRSCCCVCDPIANSNQREVEVKVCRRVTTNCRRFAHRMKASNPPFTCL